MFSPFARLFCALSLATSLVAASVFSGAVSDCRTGKSIPEAILTLGSKVMRADAKGEFKIEGDGNEVSARAYGYSRARITADPHGATGLQLKLTSVIPHALYLSYWGVGTPSIREAALRLVGTTPINAVVIDVKADLGYHFLPGVRPHGERYRC